MGKVSDLTAITALTGADELYAVDASGAVSRKIIASNLATSLSSLAGAINVKDKTYGAVGDGVTDDAVALQAAFDAGNDIWLPPGIYLSSAKLTAANKNIRIFGRWAEIRFTAATDGIEITQNGPCQSFVGGLWLSTTQQEPGTALSIDYTGIGSLSGHRQLKLVRVSKMEIRGVDYLSQGWTKGIFMDECNGAALDDILIQGRRDQAGSGATEFWPGMTHGIDNRSSLDLSPTNFVFSTVRVRGADKAFSNLGVMEGLRYLDCTGLSSRDGIFDDRREIVGADTVDPWLTVANCHFNTSRYGVRTQHGDQNFIHDNLIYQFQGGSGEDWWGIHTVFGSYQSIHDNFILGDLNSVNARVGIELDNAKRSHPHDNTFVRCLNPIHINDTAGGTTDIRPHHNEAWDDAGAQQQVVSYDGTVDPLVNSEANYWGVIDSGSNTGGGATTLTLGTPVNIGTFTVSNEPVGSLFRVTVDVQASKGGTAGSTKINIEKTTGAGAATFLGDRGNSAFLNENHLNGTNWRCVFSTIFEKTTAGTLVMAIQGLSNGSAGSVADGDLQFMVERLR